jgi:hypothetical protein
LSAVGVDVDEAGRNDEPLHVHDPFGRVVNRRRNARDGIAGDREISHVPRARGAVDDAAAFEDEVVSRRLGRNQDGRQQQGENQSFHGGREIIIPLLRGGMS